MLTTSTIKDRIERHDVVFITNQNYDKIRERNKTTIIRFHKKKLSEIRDNSARIHLHAGMSCQL